MKDPLFHSPLAPVTFKLMLHHGGSHKYTVPCIPGYVLLSVRLVWGLCVSFRRHRRIEFALAPTFKSIALGWVGRLQRVVESM